MKTRNKVLSLAAVLALGLGGFGGTFALWKVEKDVTASSGTFTSGHLKLSEDVSISDKWIDLSGVPAANLVAKATTPTSELTGDPVLAPGGVYGKIITVTPDLKGQNLVAKLKAQGGEATGVDGTNPFSIKIAKIWTTGNESAAVDGTEAIEFVEAADKITLPNAAEPAVARIVTGTAFNVLLVAQMDQSATASMDVSGITLPKVKVIAEQVAPSDLVAAEN